MVTHTALLEALLPITRQAGDAIMQIYQQGGAYVQQHSQNKEDGSPVTKADQQAEEIILNGLKALAPHIPIISEENSNSHGVAPAEQFFLVDPLDGTKEFLKADGLGSFTVNIALIEKGVAMLGVVFAPALERLFYGARGLGAWENGVPIKPCEISEGKERILLSLSHSDPRTLNWVNERVSCGAENGEQRAITTCPMGSSLKFGLLAAGEADFYPRFSPTMEWDTAAGHAVLEAAGGHMSHWDGRPFLYGKENYRNGGFIARGAQAML